jgi:LmbE family N-acetylglucosaminyl deacetylase
MVSNIKIENKRKNKIKNIMIVAHPDDELIFGGKELIKNSGKYLVICLTNLDNSIRYTEFVKMSNKLNFDYIIYNHKDLFNQKTIYKSYQKHLNNLLNELFSKNKINKIVTHNKKGEYGHSFHIAIHNYIVNYCNQYNLLNKLYVFELQKNNLSKNIYEKKYKLMENIYESEFKVIDSLDVHNFMKKETLIKYKL